MGHGGGGEGIEENNDGGSITKLYVAFPLGSGEGGVRSPGVTYRNKQGVFWSPLWSTHCCPRRGWIFHGPGPPSLS